ncbi:MAG: putative toxin-antitoxin system toxin component, PIN family [Candidatus Auribacterota bacterium]|nr:putative toxin-antitoxin system toxin component, PIN family [Candidatus Auribacterota bacterium]
MKVVLDTNVLIAAFISHGVCNELLEYCALNHEIILSGFILGELEEKLRGKFGFSKRETESVIRILKSRCAIVQAADIPHPISRDPDDDNIIAAAISGLCDCIITGDKDLLVLHQVSGIQIIPPNYFWTFERESSE